MKLTYLKSAPLLLLLLVAGALASENTPYAEKTVLSATPQRTVMTMTFDESFVLDNAAMAMAPQDLAFGSALLAIAPMGSPAPRVLAVEFSTQRVTSALDDEDIPTEEHLVTVSSPVIMHGLRLAAVNVAPIVRTAEGTRAVSRVDFEVETAAGIGENPLLNPRPIHWAFEPVFRQMVDNLDELDPLIALDAPARFLILASTQGYSQDLANLAQFNTWLDLKRRKGYTIQIATLSDIFASQGDSSNSGIRNFVTATYNDLNLPPLVYACVVGDFDGGGSFPRGFPSLVMENPEYPGPDNASFGDNYYFCAEGNDYMADVFHGRISAQTQTQFAAYFAKAVAYETEPFLDDPGWFESVTCVAGNFTDNGTFPVTPVWNMNWARQYVMDAGCIANADTFYFHDQTDDQTEWTEEIIQDINSGVCGVWYRGWASQREWQYPVLRVTDLLSGVQTGPRHPAVFGIVCGSGDFTYPQSCLGEVFTTGLGTVSNPNGALVFVGASDLHTNTRHNNTILAQMLESMIVRDIRSTGALVAAGKLDVFRQFPFERDTTGFVNYYAYHIYNILGDPEVPLYFCQPNSLNANFPATIPQGQSYVNVTVTDGSAQPVEGAVVAIRGTAGQTATTRLTDASGFAAIPVDLSGVTTAQLTVWKHTCLLRNFDISVTSLNHDPQIAGVTYNAGEDGLPNPGETFSLMFTIANRGTEATPFSIATSSLSNFLTVLSGDATVPNIEPNGQAAASTITLQADAQNWANQEAVIRLAFNDGFHIEERDFRFTLAAPEPQITAFVVQDADGFLSPGETSDIAVTIRNLGQVPANDLSATVYSFDNSISFPDNSVTWTSVGVGETITSNTTFSATLANGVAPGRQIALRLGFSWNGGDFATSIRLFVAGEVTPNVPTGPDDYGYYAYEDTDIGYAATPAYSWQELDPQYGGSGGEAHLTNDDRHFQVTLPQPFSFYGETYNSAWICSNGWLSFGDARIPEFRNWEIPSPIGPPTMVCPFWDDLISPADTLWPNDFLDFNIWTRAEANRYIVEWRTLNNAGTISDQTNYDRCIFQLVLEFDNQGDDEILFLYNEIHNTDTRNNYATVGIQNETHLDGLGLTYANSYVASASPLAAGRAIRFTTTPPDGFLDSDNPVTLPSTFALHAAYPNPFNPATQLRFDLTQNAHTTLKVYDIVGREVATLIDQTMTAGTHVASFNAVNLASGLYFARLQSGDHTAVQKLVLMK